MWTSAACLSGSLEARLAEGLKTAHSCLDPASGVIAGPLLLVRPIEAPGRPKDVVAGAGGGAVLLPQASVPADRYDEGAATIQDCGMAPPGVEGAVAGHGADLFIGQDLIQQARQHGAVPSRLKVIPPPGCHR